MKGREGDGGEVKLREGKRRERHGTDSVSLPDPLKGISTRCLLILTQDSELDLTRHWQERGEGVGDEGQRRNLPLVARYKALSVWNHGGGPGVYGRRCRRLPAPAVAKDFAGAAGSAAGCLLCSYIRNK